MRISFLSDAGGWGVGVRYSRDMYIPRRFALCVLACAFLIALCPEDYARVLRIALKLYRDVAFRRAHGYSATRIVVARQEYEFLSDYSAKHRIPIPVLLTAGYILYKNVVLRGKDLDDPELSNLLREGRCAEAMSLVLEKMPKRTYEKYFINYVPGLSRWGRAVEM